MRAHKLANPVCAWCGSKKKLETHYDTPCQVNPFKASDPDNMATLCRVCHLVVGHNGSFRYRYVENIKEICAAVLAVRISQAVGYKTVKSP